MRGSRSSSKLLEQAAAAGARRVRAFLSMGRMQKVGRKQGGASAREEPAGVVQGGGGGLACCAGGGQGVVQEGVRVLCRRGLGCCVGGG